MHRTMSSPWYYSTYSLNIIPEERIPRPDYDDDLAEFEEDFDALEDGRYYQTTASPHSRFGTSAHNLSTTPIYQEGPSVALIDENPTTPQRLANFFSRPFRTNPLKRTKSVSKLDRRGVQQNEKIIVREPDFKRSQENLSNLNGLQRRNLYQQDQNHLRSSRSHESLLSYSTATHMIDMRDNSARPHPVHPSVLDVPNCFRVANTYYACRTPLERAKWIEK
ncbi:unnamed protein product, partial [Mesorhabditis belari]|uniref:Ras/Rap GTPase-activating protein SynGAP-like PH domain-containing protein n=1 Tax=Mesorhabditis belari TaxID=2138241 RepID=A0AAF3ES84_9BILA